mmetsp:Transcript_84508/g.149588  ORF Transcript_84508/g.149588 Transcript_84508/m.149588 type:complete len:1666 (-) Transcript_84508:29-5026(-)
MARRSLFLLHAVLQVAGTDPNLLRRERLEIDSNGELSPFFPSSLGLIEDAAHGEVGAALMQSVVLTSENFGQGIAYQFREDELERGIDCKMVSAPICCSLSPPKVLVKDGDNCSCEGIGPSRDEVMIARTCNEFLKPCRKVTKEYCCGSNPKKARLSNGEKCWCEGPTQLPDGNFTDQLAIDKACAAIEGSCLELSEVHCCSMLPKTRLVRSAGPVGERCECRSARDAAEQAEFDGNCSKLIVGCGELPEEQCCRMSPRKYMMQHEGMCWCNGPFLRDGKIYDQRQLDLYCQNLEKATRRPCSEISQEHCCQMFPKRILVKLKEGMCDCEVPVDTTQVEQLCLNPPMSCDDSAAAKCCSMSPSRWLRPGSEEGQCFCSGDSMTVGQLEIDNRCNSLLRNCSDLSVLDCCQAKQVRRVSPSGLCYCMGAFLDGTVDISETYIESVCADTKLCSELSDQTCCAKSPKMLRVPNGDSSCSCMGPEAGTSQAEIDRRCHETLRPCRELSDADCCLLSPKRMRMSDNQGNCWCSEPREVDGTYYDQLHIDGLCESIVKPCAEVTEEYCCSFSPARVKSDVERGGLCSCYGPSNLYTQKSIDAVCALNFRSCSNVTERTCCSKTPKQVRLISSDDSCWCTGPVYMQGKHFNQSVLDSSCKRLVQNCSTMSKEYCCSMSPQRIRRKDSDGICRCDGPTKGFDQTNITEYCKNIQHMPCTMFSQAQCCSMEPKLELVMRKIDGRMECFCTEVTTAVRQRNVDSECKSYMGDCKNFTDEHCCAQDPPMIRVQGKSGCWCTGPFDYVDGNISKWTQAGINGFCKHLIKTCDAMSQAECCSMSPQRLLLPYKHRDDSSSEVCTCSGPNLKASQDFIDSNCSKTLKSCLELRPSECCAMTPKKARFSNGHACLCGGPPVGSNQSYIDDYCRLTVMPCKDMPIDHCCTSNPMMKRVEEGNGMCYCSGPTSDSYFSQENIDALCAAAMQKPCGEMSDTYCCSLPLPMMRVELIDSNSTTRECMCQPAGNDLTQEQINSTCRDILRPCVFSNYTATLEIESQDLLCCHMSPKKIRLSSQSGLCWCNGPYNATDGGMSLNQTYIDKYCQGVEDAVNLVRRPCDELSSAQCCQLSPKRYRASTDSGLCSCVAAVPSLDQLAIDTQCSQIVKDCIHLPDSLCCEKNPPEIRVMGKNGKCWCSGPFTMDDGKYIAQSVVTEYCKNGEKPCGPATVAECCSSYPKQMSVRQGNGKCTCSGPGFSPSLKYYVTQKEIDANCSKEVQSCHSLSPATCCGHSPRKARMGNGKFCTCTGPLNASGVEYNQSFLDALCEHTVKPCSEMPLDHCCMAWPKMMRVQGDDSMCYCSTPTEAYGQAEIDESCNHYILPMPCENITATHCCEMYPRRVRVELGGGMCQCKSSQDIEGRNYSSIEAECNALLSPCSFTNVSSTARFEQKDLYCCSMSPKQMRMQNNRGQCWCNGPLLTQSPKANITQSYIDDWCRKMEPILSRRKRPCREASEAECCKQNPRQILLRNSSNDTCWCNPPAEVGGIEYNQSKINQVCGQQVKFCDELHQGHCCTMTPKRLLTDDGSAPTSHGQRCLCSGPNTTTDQKAIDKICEKTVKSCESLTMSDCCDNQPAQALMRGRDGLCWCSGPIKVNGTLHVQEWIDVQCKIAITATSLR